jgi:hypothetical protein
MFLVGHGMVKYTLFKGFANVRFQNAMFEGGRLEDKFYFHSSDCTVLHTARQACAQKEQSGAISRKGKEGYPGLKRNAIYNVKGIARKLKLSCQPTTADYSR